MSCVVTDSGPESKGEMFLLASVLVGLEFKQKKKAYERTEDAQIEESKLFCLAFFHLTSFTHVVIEQVTLHPSAKIEHVLDSVMCLWHVSAYRRKI